MVLTWVLLVQMIDIIGVALDLDNNKIGFGRNGQWSNPTGSCNQTYANSKQHIQI